MATKKYKIPHEHASVINLAISSLKQHNGDVALAMDQSFGMVAAPSVSNELCNLQQQRRDIEQELEKMQQTRDNIRDAQTRKSMNFFRLMTALCTLQLTFGYYFIFEVDWLGWDLVEPLTYTFGEGTAVLGMLYMLRHRKLQGYNYSELKENFVNITVQKKIN